MCCCFSPAYWRYFKSVVVQMHNELCAAFTFYGGIYSGNSSGFCRVISIHAPA